VGGALASVGEGRGAYVVLEGNLRGRDHLEDVGLYGKMILIYIFK
jgi:hypothetical protein